MNERHEQRFNDRTVTVAVAPNEIVARMWQEALRDEGIIAALKPGGAGHGFASTALFEHYVEVLEDQADRARDFIAEFEAEDEDISDSSSVNDDA